MSGLVHVLASGEVSKAPFYAAGAALALWAVAVSAVGLARERFPGSQAGSAAVIAVTGLLMAAVMATGVLTASKPTKEEGERATSQKEAVGNQRPEGQLGGTSNGPALESEKTQGAAAGGGGGAVRKLSVTADSSGQLAFEQKALSSSAGNVTIQLTNPSPIPHDVRIEQDSRQIGGTKQVANARTAAKVTLRPGQYTFYCSVPGHRQAGMQGTLTVS